jgi:MOSC domain-containing protein YiiM
MHSADASPTYTTQRIKADHPGVDNLLRELATKGFHVEAGQLGENITTANVDLLALPKNTILHIGASASLQVIGLRNPCTQIETFQSGLLAAVLDKDNRGKVVRKTGIMAIVLSAGYVKPNDAITVQLPTHPHQSLTIV